jgi:hypothetical protein
VPLEGDPGYDEDVVADETAGGAVPLGRLLPAGVDSRGRRTAPRVVVYRRPLEARANDRHDLADLVHAWSSTRWRACCSSTRTRSTRPRPSGPAPGVGDRPAACTSQRCGTSGQQRRERPAAPRSRE